MKLKRILLAMMLAGFSSALFAQVAADPLDFFYTDLNVWETSGIINNLPAARPYPLQMVKEILATVIEQGDAEQRKIAEAHYRRFFGRILTYGGKSEAAIDTEKSLKQLSIALSFDINYEMEEYVTLSASIDGWATNKEFDQEIVPAWNYSDKDIISDNAKVGPMWILPSINSSIAVGTTEYYLNAGLMRGSFGPFPENGVVVGQQALHSGQYSFAINKPFWGINVSMYSLSATSADDGDSFNPEKFLAVHNLEFRPFKWLSVSILESIMYGGRMELMYLLPLSPYMISQGVAGLNDNGYIGGMFTVKPMDGLKIDGVLYADDLSFNDLIKLNFDTKMRFAGQLGASYAPRSSGIFTLASLDYTMVTPYTYSHKPDDSLSLTDPNFQNYQHAGKSFGAALDPNSDRINLKLKLRPLEGIDFDLVGILIRHGNVNEGMDDKRIAEYITVNSYITDGSILNPSGTLTPGVGHAFNYSTPFLVQDTLQYIWQTGFDATCRLPVLKTGGYMVFRFAYRFEANMNEGINKKLYQYQSGYNPTPFADPDNPTEAEKILRDAELTAYATPIATQQLTEWREAAIGTVFNNYISAGFEYYY